MSMLFLSMKVNLSLPLIFLTIISTQVLAEDLSVAVASNFTAPMKAIIAAFEQDSEHKVQISYGSSGRIYAQIINGAPFQVFFSADQEKPQRLEESGLVIENSRFTYAIGGLALWSADNQLIDGSASILQSGNYRKLAFANPNLAPYGDAALEVIKNLGLEETTKKHWVQGENIAQTYQFVATGNASIGFVSLSQVMENGELKQGSVWLVPNELYAPIKQDVVMLKNAENNIAARDLLTFIQSDNGLNIIKSFGYQ